MAQETLEKRVDRLEQLPRGMTALESQIVQLREEMRGEFSATRAELRQEMRELFAASERHARLLHEDVIARIATIRGG